MDQKFNYQSRIHILRAEFRITQEELADEIGISRSTLSKIENNAANLSLILAKEIAAVFNLPIEQVFNFDE